jgi:hypothetical protein
MPKALQTHLKEGQQQPALRAGRTPAAATAAAATTMCSSNENYCQPLVGVVHKQVASTTAQRSVAHHQHFKTNNKRDTVATYDIEVTR